MRQAAIMRHCRHWQAMSVQNCGMLRPCRLGLTATTLQRVERQVNLVALWSRKNSQQSAASLREASLAMAVPLLTCKIKSKTPHNFANDRLCGVNASSKGASTSIQCLRRPNKPRNSEHDPFNFEESSASVRRTSKTLWRARALTLPKAGNCQLGSARNPLIFSFGASGMLAMCLGSSKHGQGDPWPTAATDMLRTSCTVWRLWAPYNVDQGKSQRSRLHPAPASLHDQRGFNHEDAVLQRCVHPIVRRTAQQRAMQPQTGAGQ